MDYSSVFLTLNDIFIRVFNLSLSATFIIYIIFLLRAAFAESPKWWRCLLWLIAGVRLAFPFSIESILSLNPNRYTIDPETIYSNKLVIDSGFESVDTTVNEYMASNYYEGVTVPSNFKLNIISVLSIIWLIGILVFLSYYFINYIRYKSKLKTATLLFDNVFQSEFVTSPFVFGIIRPKIYIPYGLDDDSLRYVLAHEKSHIRRCDHLIKQAAFIILSCYWFNPFIWIAFRFLSIDIELACDEKVVKNLSEDEKSEYSKTLLNLSVNKKWLKVCPVPFSEIDIKNRVRGIMNYKKPKFWIVVISVIGLILCSIALLTDPIEKKDKSISVSEELNEIITQTIVENENNKYSGDFGCAAHVILGAEKDGPVDSDKIEYTTIEVFVMARYSEFGIKNGTLIETGGMISPLALVFEVDENENYTLLEYWEPGMGSDYIKSLEKRFPRKIDYMTDEYNEQLRVECESKAYEHFGVSSTGYDEVYTLSTEQTTLSSSFLPKLSINNKNKTFMFMYDLLSSYLSTGTYEIIDDELIANTSDGKFKYVFDVINKKELRFNAKKSVFLPVINKDLSYEIKHGDSFIIGKPKNDGNLEYTTTVQIVGEEPTDKVNNIPSFTEDIYDYTLSVIESSEDIIWQISGEEFRQENGYSVFAYSVDKVYIEVGEISVSLDDAIDNKNISVDALIDKARYDTKDGKVKAITYKDGGSTLYVYDDYSIIKLNRITGGRKDVFIGPVDMSINDLTDFLDSNLG